jgi:hypothetical protein
MGKGSPSTAVARCATSDSTSPRNSTLTPGDLVGLVLFALPDLILSAWSLIR